VDNTQGESNAAELKNALFARGSSTLDGCLDFIIHHVLQLQQ